MHRSASSASFPSRPSQLNPVRRRNRLRRAIAAASGFALASLAALGVATAQDQAGPPRVEGRVPDAPSAGAAPAGPTIAPSASADADAEVVVTATRLPTPPAQIGSSVSVITGEEIRARQQPFVADVLRGVPSLDVARSGAGNQVTSAFLRGGESHHTLVLIDGIEANDPTSPNRAFNFANLTVDDVERIEVLRGPQGTLWGSNAMGGVVNVITKRGKGPLNGYVFGEGGSYGSYRAGAGFNGNSGRVNYSLSLSHAASDGISAAGEKYGNNEADGYDNSAIAGRVGFNLSEQLDVDLIARYNHAETDIDDFGGPGGDDPDRTLYSDDAFFRLQPRLLLLDGKLEQTWGLAYTHYHRRDNDETFPDEFDGGILSFDLQNDLKLADNHTLTFGLDASQEQFRSDTVSEETADLIGVYLQDAISFDDRLFLTAGLRFEDHSESESAWTYRVTGAYLFPSRTKLRASYGTGFKAPSLSNLYSGFGSPDLEPEEVRGWDVGVEQTFMEKDRLTLEATYFDNRYENLIDFDFVTSSLMNVGKAETSGVELAATFRLDDALSVGLNYTYLDTLNTETDQELLRRAPHKAGAFVDWRYTQKGSVTVSAAYYSSRADIDPVSFGRTRIGGYTLLNVATSYRLTDRLTITGRIENLLDQDYEEVAGFGTTGITAYGGLRLAF